MAALAGRNRAVQIHEEWSTVRSGFLLGRCGLSGRYVSSLIIVKLPFAVPDPISEAEYEQFGSLQVLSYNNIVRANAVGVKRVLRYQAFKGYLKEVKQRKKPAKQDEIVTILQACTNCRDQLLILLLAETGFRIGEILGVDYAKDIDYENHLVCVYFRGDNDNDARAKNAEYRKAKVSDETFEFLQYECI